MIDVNQCTILGRLVREPSIHTGKNGTCVQFIIAVNRRWTDKLGEQRSETAFLSCKAFNGWTTTLADRPKGTPLFVTGRLRTESWGAEDTSGTQLTVICESVQVLSSPQRETSVKAQVATPSGAVPF